MKKMLRGRRLSSAVLLVMAAALLAGCASRGSCAKPQPYDNAGSIPPLTGANGLVIPQAAGALVVPAAPAKPVPFATEHKAPDGKLVASCLDEPPAMPKPQADFVTESVKNASHR